MYHKLWGAEALGRPKKQKWRDSYWGIDGAVRGAKGTNFACGNQMTQTVVTRFPIGEILEHELATYQCGYLVLPHIAAALHPLVLSATFEQCAHDFFSSSGGRPTSYWASIA